MKDLTDYQAQHFLWSVQNRVGWITLNRPEKKNPLTFESYAELRDLMRRLPYSAGIKVVVISGADGNFCSGGDVQEIIGPLTRMSMPELLNFTRMTGDLVKAMRACPQPVIAAVDGVCAGAGAILAMSSDIRLSTPRSKTAFLFTRVGLAGCDMGACAILPRIIGHGRAAELLLSGRSVARRGHAALSRTCRRSDICARHHQDYAESGVEHGIGAGVGVRGASAGGLHDDRGFSPRLPGIFREAASDIRR